MVKVVAQLKPLGKAGIQSEDVITRLIRRIFGPYSRLRSKKCAGGPRRSPLLSCARALGSFDVKIVRDVIHIDPVKYNAENDVAIFASPPSMNRQ